MTGEGILRLVGCGSADAIGGGVVCEQKNGALVVLLDEVGAATDGGEDPVAPPSFMRRLNRLLHGFSTEAAGAGGAGGGGGGVDHACSCTSSSVASTGRADATTGTEGIGAMDGIGGRDNGQHGGHGNNRWYMYRKYRWGRGTSELSAVDTGLAAGHLLAVKNWFQHC